MRVGGLTDVVVEGVLESRPFGYRNRVAFPVSRPQGKPLEIGFYERGTHSVVDTDSCPIQDDRLEPMLGRIKKDLEVCRK